MDQSLWQVDSVLSFSKIDLHFFDIRREALCDARAQIFRVAVRGVKDTIPDGFAAIKLSGLGRLGGMEGC